jgi:hypothetical protein
LQSENDHKQQQFFPFFTLEKSIAAKEFRGQSGTPNVKLLIRKTRYW